MPMLVITGSAITAAVRPRASTFSTAAMSLNGTASVVALTSWFMPMRPARARAPALTASGKSRTSVSSTVPW